MPPRVSHIPGGRNAESARVWWLAGSRWSASVLLVVVAVALKDSGLDDLEL